MTHSNSNNHELEAVKAQLAEFQEIMAQQQRERILGKQVQGQSVSGISQDPLVAGVGAIRTLSTVTGFELFSAALIGLVTGGPFGAILSPLALRGFQGKWGAWQALGLVAAPVSWVAFFIIASVASASTLNSQSVSPIASPIAIEAVSVNMEDA